MGVGERPAGQEPLGVAVILGLRALLIALLLAGSTGSAQCQVICAQAADSQALLHARPAELAAQGHAGCHGGGAASPEPLAESPPESCERDCCTVLTHGTMTPPPAPGPASAASPALAGLDLVEVRTRLDLLRRPPPAECLESPFQFRNPPLLI